MSKLYVKAIRSAIFGIIAFAALIFVPAGTLNYWQGWAFLATFVFSTLIITVYLARNDPKLLGRRITAEKVLALKVIASTHNFPFRGPIWCFPLSTGGLSGRLLYRPGYL